MTPPLLQGGQGRSAREVDSSARFFGWLMLLGIIALAAASVAS